MQYKYELKLLQDSAPVLASFILKLPFSEPIPVDACYLIKDLCDYPPLAPFQSSVSQTFPPLPPDNKLAYFLNLPPVRGRPAYLADQRTIRHT